MDKIRFVTQCLRRTRGFVEGKLRNILSPNPPYCALIWHKTTLRNDRGMTSACGPSARWLIESHSLIDLRKVDQNRKKRVRVVLPMQYIISEHFISVSFSYCAQLKCEPRGLCDCILCYRLIQSLITSDYSLCIFRPAFWRSSSTLHPDLLWYTHVRGSTIFLHIAVTVVSFSYFQCFIYSFGAHIY